MKPTISDTGFGYVILDGARIEHDILIRLSGAVKKRKKKLSKSVYGTSHKVSLAEAQHIYQKGAERLRVGSGQYDSLTLSDEAAEYFNQKECEVELKPTPDAIKRWNKARGAVIGLFHVTC
jgi:hypothetical protein